jgi:hypothetical protein
VLVPPEVADKHLPPDIDYVCLACGRTYTWIGNPPKLTLLNVVRGRSAEGDDDED